MRRLIHLIAALLLTLASAAPVAANGPPAEKKKGGGESFLALPTMTAGVLRPNGKRGVLTVEGGLDIPDTPLRDRAAASTPRLRDAYVRFLTTYAAAVPAGGAPNPDAISAALQRSTDQILGKPGARFLIGTVMIN